MKKFLVSKADSDYVQGKRSTVGIALSDEFRIVGFRLAGSDHTVTVAVSNGSI